MSRAQSIQQARAKDLKIMCIGLIAFGLIFAIIGGVIVSKKIISKNRCTDEVKGVVIENVLSSSNEDGSSYAPVFEYEYNGVKHRYKSNVYTSPPSYDVGESVTIMVDPDDPEDIYVIGYYSTWVFGIVFLAVGLGVSVAGLIVLVINISKRRAPVSLEDEIAQYQSGGSSMDDMYK